MAQMLAPVSFAAPDLPSTTGGVGPLSGGVAQVINPWRWFANVFGNQFSLFSINLGRSSAPQVEAEILDEVGSYGRQIGRIGEAVEVLVAQLKRNELQPEALAAIEAFSVQMREIKRIKAHAEAKRS